ncbi:Xyloglucan-specific endo-beta-1,4-glucanase A [Trametes pubescens]|uniref:Xyloglucan-specific endo-beta-1,4-glucanase A n=1 Tax=Trametes pubescens TaxID=154538 RepID=A0A1M2V3M3_TRAPU|nr:Xyloglucan-specific endo-beta-1,4-glucanase A [Trametes pubescens]
MARLCAAGLIASLVHVAAAQTTLQGNDCTAAGAYTLCQNLWGASKPSFLLRHASPGYDLWTGVPQAGDPASAASSYEIMIWLSNRGGVGGIGNVVAQNLRVGGHTWTLKHGPNSNWDVFSFITAEGDITDFRADLADFFQYLVDQQGVAKTQFVQAIQVGTEPFTGAAELVTTNFSVDISTTADQSTSASPSPTPSPTSSQASVSGTPTASSASSKAGTSSAVPSSNTTVSSSSISLAPDPQSTFAPIQVGVRKTSGPQCVLQPPGQTLRKRREKRSWFRFFV